MKIAILFFMGLFSCNYASAATNIYVPWIEDPHFAHYTCLMVQSKLMQIEEIVKEIQTQENEEKVHEILVHIENTRQILMVNN